MEPCAGSYPRAGPRAPPLADGDRLLHRRVDRADDPVGARTSETLGVRAAGLHGRVELRRAGLDLDVVGQLAAPDPLDGRALGHGERLRLEVGVADSDGLRRRE